MSITFKGEEFMKILHIVEIILHKKLDKSKFMCLEYLVSELINYLILYNYTRLNYLRFIYAQFLMSFLTAVYLSYYLVVNY